MNWKAATLILACVTVSVSVSAGSPQLFLDRLTEEPINQSYQNNSIRFTTGYLNQTVTYQDALIPESCQSSLKKWLVKSKADNGLLTELQIQYEFNQSTTCVSVLDGEKFDAKITFNKTGVEVFKTKGGKIEVRARAHYEHLIFNYSVHNATVEPRHVVRSYERVVSGTAPAKLPYSATVNRLNDSFVRQTVRYDNLYDPQNQKVLALVYEQGAGIAWIDSENANQTPCSVGYSSYVRPRLREANVSFVLDDLGSLQYACYNVSFPADRVVTITTVFDENAAKITGNSLSLTDRTYRTYLAGSGGSLRIDSPQELCGDVTNSTGGIYDSINISGTVTICDYNSSSWTGRVNLTANRWISVTGTIDGSAAGYNSSSSEPLGPGSGKVPDPNEEDGGGGGAYGGSGGDGGGSSADGTGGIPVGNLTADIIRGSSGAPGTTGSGTTGTGGGDGGAAVLLQAPYIISNGTINVAGADGPDGRTSVSDDPGSGGGSGGGISIRMGTGLLDFAQLTAQGGTGGNGNNADGGGGGGGGRVKLFYHRALWNQSMSISVGGGAGGKRDSFGQDGETGGDGVRTVNTSFLVREPTTIWLNTSNYPFTVTASAVTLNQEYTGVRTLQITETENIRWRGINTTKSVNKPEKCEQINRTTANVSAAATLNVTVGFSCVPGTEGEPSLTLLDSGDTVTAWYNTTNMQIYTNLTENTPITWPIPKSEIDNVGDRKAGSLRAIVDGSSKNVTVHDHGSTFHVHIGTEHTNSSMHAVGDHVAGLTYQYSTGTGSPQQSGGGGGGGSSGENETMELLVKFEPRDTYQVPINQSETIEFVVKNLATRKNTVTLTALPDQSTGCQYITLKRTEVDLLPKDKGLTGEFYRDRIGVEITMPSEDVIETSGGRIHCVYSAKATHGEAETLVITAVPGTGFFAGLNDLFQRLLSATLISETTQCLSVDECAPGERTTLPIPGAVGWVLIVLLLGSGVFLARR